MAEQAGTLRIQRPDSTSMSVGTERAAPAPGVKGDIAASQEGQDSRARSLREAADQGIAKVRENVRQNEENPEPLAEPPPPREEVESVVLKMPNGREVEYGPRRASTIMKTAQIFGDSRPNQLMIGIVSAIMWVRKIDGEPVDLPGNMADVQKLCNELSDEGVDILSAARSKYWPGVTTDDLPVLKKNLRGS